MYDVGYTFAKVSSPYSLYNKLGVPRGVRGHAVTFKEGPLIHVQCMFFYVTITDFSIIAINDLL